MANLKYSRNDFFTKALAYLVTGKREKGFIRCVPGSLPPSLAFL
jgi:hypothetical protein